MKNRIISIFLLAAMLITSAFAFLSCSKDSEKSTDTISNTAEAEDNATLSDDQKARIEADRASYDEFKTGLSAELEEEKASYSKYPDFISPVVHEGNDIFVDSAADGPKYDGTIEDPYKQLSLAISMAEPGDTIYLREGTYDEKNYISKCGSENAWFVIKPYQNEKVVFDNNFGSSDSCIIFEGSAGYWKVEGFEIKNYTGAGIWIKGGRNYCIENMEIHNISNPSFTNYGTEGILGGGENVLVSKCRIYDIGFDRKAQLDHCIYLGGPQNWVIDSNMLYNAPGGGIHQYCSDAPEAKGKNVYVWNNLIYNTYYGIVLSSCSRYYISNNTVVDSNFCDFFLLGYVNSCVIQNNIFYSDFTEDSTFLHGVWSDNNIQPQKPKSVFIYPSGGPMTANVFKNNLLFGETKEKLMLKGNGYKPEQFADYDKSATHESYILSSPLFSGNGNFGFQLSDASPCINKSLINEYTPGWNFNGEERTNNNNIGAY